MKKWIKSHQYTAAFLLSFVLGFLIIIPWIISGKGVFTFLADYNTQQIPFNIYMNNAISNNNYLWNWYNDLGASFIGSFGLYNLFSPFTMILWLFPAKFVPYLMGPVFMLKYGVAGLTSYMFLRRYVKNYKYALLGSILYAFSGFQLTNILFYHFHDVVAFFPLLLYSLDKLVIENKKGTFLLSVALNAITNYYFFIGQVVFVLIYYIITNITKSYKWSFKNFMAIFVESVLGLGITAFLFIPSIYFVLGNPRIDGSWTLQSMLIPNITNVAELIRSFVMPNESMNYRAIISEANFCSVESYLPFVSAILWLSYLIKKPKKWSNILMVILLIFMFIPILNSSFSMFTTAYYIRWFYMAILIMVLNSIKVLDENISLKSGLIVNILLIIASLCLAIYICKDGTLIYNQESFIVIIIFMILNIFLLCLIFEYKKYKELLLFIGIVFYILSYGNYFIYNNKKIAAYEEPITTLKSLNNVVEGLEENVRYNSNNYFYNIGLYSKRMFVTSWNSNIEGSSFNFYNSMGINRGVSTQISIYDKDLQEFLSIKYIILDYLDENLIQLYGEPIEENKYYIYINENYKPFGIDYNYYILESDFNKIANENKSNILNNAVVINKEQLKKYNNILTEYEQGVENESDLYQNEFTLTNDGFKANIKSSKEKVIVYTVPYSDGWTATIDGTTTEIEKVDGGLMAIKIKKGENKIEFNYYPPGLKIGLTVTSLSLVGTICYFILKKIKK